MSLPTCEGAYFFPECGSRVALAALQCAQSWARPLTMLLGMSCEVWPSLRMRS